MDITVIEHNQLVLVQLSVKIDIQMLFNINVCLLSKRVS